MAAQGTGRVRLLQFFEVTGMGCAQLLLEALVLASKGRIPAPAIYDIAAWLRPLRFPLLAPSIPHQGAILEVYARRRLQGQPETGVEAKP